MLNLFFCNLSVTQSVQAAADRDFAKSIFFHVNWIFPRIQPVKICIVAFALYRKQARLW